jgi:hypothetical protein
MVNPRPPALAEHLHYAHQALRTNTDAHGAVDNYRRILDTINRCRTLFALELRLPFAAPDVTREVALQLHHRTWSMFLSLSRFYIYLHPMLIEVVYLNWCRSHSLGNME